MKYRITIVTAAGTHTLFGIGDLGNLINAEYDAGALGITYVVIK
jgi:hypothetical protein